jgi:ferredoxin
MNCTGIGSCGTCAVEIHGEVGPLTAMERWRLAFPPHHPSRGLRLACQVKVTSDLVVIKHSGFWGQHVDAPEDD